MESDLIERIQNGFMQRQPTLADIWDAMRETCLQTAPIFYIASGAKTFLVIIALTAVAPALVEMVSSADWSFSLLLTIAVM